MDDNEYRVTVRFGGKGFKERFRRMAEAQDRSCSWIIRKAAKEYLEQWERSQEATGSGAEASDRQ